MLMKNLKGPNVIRYQFDDVVVDPSNFRVHKRDKVLNLAPRAFDLLVYLIKHAERVVEKQELFGQVWQGAFCNRQRADA